MMKYYSVDEILEEINIRFGYEFEGREQGDNLITRKTWNKYFERFFEGLEDELYAALNVDELDEIDNMISEAKSSRVKNKNKHKKYREDLVNEIIQFNSKRLTKQLNSQRVLITNTSMIKAYEALAKAETKKVDNSIYDMKIFKSKAKAIEMGGMPEITTEEIQNKKEELINIIFDQLIDEEKVNDDVWELLISNSVIHGSFETHEANEGQVESSGAKIDAKKYLKDTVQKDLSDKVG